MKRQKQKLLPKKNTLLLFTVIVGFGLITFGLHFYKRSASLKFSGPIEHIKTGNVGEYSSLSIIAQQEGYFSKYGLDVKLIDYPAGPPAVADMLAGKIDTATAADFVGVSNSFKGEDIKVLAAQMRASSFFMAARRDHGIHTIADLKGKTIGVTAKTAGEFYFGDFLILNNLRLSDVQLVFDSPANLANQLIQGKLDAIVSFDPHIYNVQKTLTGEVLVWPIQGDQKLSTLLYGTGELVKKRPEVVKRYLQALVEAENFANTHNQAAEQIVGHYLHYSDAYTRRIWPRLQFNLSLDQDLLINMEDQARWAIENKVVNATEIPDYLNLIYFDGMKAAKPDGITIIR